MQTISKPDDLLALYELTAIEDLLTFNIPGVFQDHYKIPGVFQEGHNYRSFLGM